MGVPSLPQHRDYESLDGWVSEGLRKYAEQGDELGLRAVRVAQERMAAARMAFNATRDILSVLKPQYTHGSPADLSHVTSYAASRSIPWMEQPQPFDHKAEMLKLLRFLESGRLVVNSGGCWSLTAYGALWLLLADASPCGWARRADLTEHMDLRWWSLAEISDAAKSSGYFHHKSGGGVGSDDLVYLNPEFPPLHGMVKVWR